MLHAPYRFFAMYECRQLSRSINIILHEELKHKQRSCKLILQQQSNKDTLSLKNSFMLPYNKFSERAIEVP